MTVYKDFVSKLGHCINKILKSIFIDLIAKNGCSNQVPTENTDFIKLLISKYLDYPWTKSLVF